MGPEDIRALRDLIVRQVGATVYGHDHTVGMLLGTFLAGGHALIEGPPGIAKTLLAKAFARALKLSFRRIQFTPDLMPSDITGVNIFDSHSSQFVFAPGPLLSDFVLADEINRTPPKTQSALLEAMEEHQITIDGKQHVLSELFFVAATQNPIEHEGTFPLPEAQLDRFLVKLHLSYPEASIEEQMVITRSAMPFRVEKEEPLHGSAEIEHYRALRAALCAIHLSPSLSRYIVKIVTATRAHPEIILGASPRSALHLALFSKYFAAIDGRGYVIPDDVQAVCFAVLNHRLIVRSDILMRDNPVQRIINEVVRSVAVPSGEEVLQAPLQ